MKSFKGFVRGVWDRFVRVMAPSSPAAMRQRGGTEWYNPVTKRYEADPVARVNRVAKTAKNRDKNKAARKARSKHRGKK